MCFDSVRLAMVIEEFCKRVASLVLLGPIVVAIISGTAYPVVELEVLMDLGKEKSLRPPSLFTKLSLFQEFPVLRDSGSGAAMRYKITAKPPIRIMVAMREIKKFRLKT